MTLLALRFLRQLTAAEVVPTLHRWRDLLRAVESQSGPLPGSSALEAFACYTIEVTDVPLEELAMALVDHLHQPKDRIMTTGQRLRAEGRAEGRVEGRVDTLRQLLRVRFGDLPPELLQRLQGGTEPELERWTERLLRSGSPGEVFAD